MFASTLLPLCQKTCNSNCCVSLFPSGSQENSMNRPTPSTHSWRSVQPRIIGHDKIIRRKASPYPSLGQLSSSREQNENGSRHTQNLSPPLPPPPPPPPVTKFSEACSRLSRNTMTSSQQHLHAPLQRLFDAEAGGGYQPSFDQLPAPFLSSCLAPPHLPCL